MKIRVLLLLTLHTCSQEQHQTGKIRKRCNHENVDRALTIEHNSIYDITLILDNVSVQ